MVAMKQYTRAEVAARAGRGGAPVWIIHKDTVYDVTRFVNEHPGGADTIEAEAGSDATKAFEDVGHSGDARSMLAQYKIGELVEEEKSYDANGKKRKVVAAPEEGAGGGGRGCLSIISCGLLGS